MNWTKGAEWRKWDLHVHSPASQNFAGDWNQFIIQLGNADCDVIGINDYFSVAGYKEIQRRLNDSGAAAEGNKPYREALEKLKGKTLLPVVECRMNNVVLDKKLKSGPRINFHLIFSPKVSPDDIETFVKSLKVKGTSIGSRYNDSKFLLDEVSVNFVETCQQLRSDGTFADRFLIWIPYDEYGGIGPINPATDTLFKEGLVSEADILGSSNKEQGDFFLWKDGKFTEDQYRKWFGRRKPCIKGSDSHNVNDELGKLKDHQSKPTDKYCWIKADPTFNGLRQIINEPEDRVYIGRIPPKMKEVRLYPTRYLSHVCIRKAADADTEEIWFDCEIPLNFDMVAIIGNKGTGKSALADVLALAGNTHCDQKYFSFLTKDRFCERNGRIAKQFEIETVWAEDTKTVTSLNSKPDLNNVELVKYIPQTYLEKVCTETEPGQQSEFQRELRKVIFSHISDADRLGKESLDELIEYKTEELTTQRNSQQQEISRLNAEVVRLEAKGTVDYAAQLDGKLKLKRKELEAHEANKPTPVEKPNNLNAEQQAVYADIGGKLENERTMLVSLETKITEHQARQKTLIEHLAVAKKLEGKFDNFESEYVRLKQECAADCKKLSLEVGTIVTLTIDRAALTQKRDALVAEKVKIDATLSLTEDSSLLSQKTACEGRIVEKIMAYLEHDMRTSQQGEMNIGSQLRKHVETKQLYDYLWSLPYLAPEYSLKLDGKDLSHLSPGERGTLLLVFYLLVDKSNSPIIVDQPEENLDSETVYRLLIPVIKEVKKRRQIIMVTHSPNIAVVCDAEQIVHAFIDRANGNRVIYTMGAIESPEINKFLVDVLEGTRPAFDNRESKYYA